MGSAPSGGQLVRASSGSVPVSAARTPSAWQVQGSSSPSCSGREWIATVRVPSVAGAPTATWRSTPPRSGRTSGLPSTSSRSRPQPASSPARIASSVRAEPGSRAVPSSRCWPSQGWPWGVRRPVSSRPSSSAGRTTAPSRGWPVSVRPRPAGSPAAPEGAVSQ